MSRTRAVCNVRGPGNVDFMHKKKDVNVHTQNQINASSIQDILARSMRTNRCTDVSNVDPQDDADTIFSHAKITFQALAESQP